MSVPSDDEELFERLGGEWSGASEAETASEWAPRDLKLRLRAAFESRQKEDEVFAALAACDVAEKTPPSLKSRVYSRLVKKQAEQGPLLELPLVKQGGGVLCVFEELGRIAPVGSALHSGNCCRVCHARVLAERLDRAPIWWPGCPYVDFQRA